MAFKIPSLSETRDFLIAVGQSVFPDRNYGNLRTYHARRATFLAAAVTQLHAHVKSVADDVMPDTAGDDGPIDRWGTILGVARKSATPARKSQAGRVFGTVATPVDADEELIHDASGLRFKIANASTIGVDEYTDVDIVAIDTGAQTRLEAGQMLRFDSTPAGLESGVRLILALDEDGEDVEAFGAYRERVLAALSEPTAGGTQADYVAWMLEVEGVANAYAYPNRAGMGTIDVVALHAGSGTARELDAGEQEDVLDYLRTLAPASLAGVGGGLRHLDVVQQPTDVEMLLESNGEAAYAPDWSGQPLTVSTWTPGTRTVKFTTDRPASMKAGHRIVPKGVASLQTGEELTIEALGVADDEIILEEAPTVALAATDLVYSGGPLITPVRDALLAHMNGETVYAGKGRVPQAASSLESTVGLEVLTYGIGPANPAGAYGTWIGGFIRAVAMQIALYKAGVRNVTIPTPAADVDGTDYEFPDDDQIGMITPDQVVVRYA